MTSQDTEHIQISPSVRSLVILRSWHVSLIGIQCPKKKLRAMKGVSILRMKKLNYCKRRLPQRKYPFDNTNTDSLANWRIIFSMSLGFYIGMALYGGIEEGWCIQHRRHKISTKWFTKNGGHHLRNVATWTKVCGIRINYFFRKGSHFAVIFFRRTHYH